MNKPGPRPAAPRRDVTLAFAGALLAAAAFVLLFRSDPPSPPPPSSSATAIDGPPKAPAKGGTGTLRGAVSMSGKAPAMEVPKGRKDADVCKNKPIKHDAVVVNAGKLKDVLVRIAAGTVPGRWTAPEEHAEIQQVDCTYVPRVLGVVTGQTIDIVNRDPTLHNAHIMKGAETFSGQAQPKGSPGITKDAPGEPSILKITCDVHPWMRTFVIVTDHPFFAVTSADGAFRIDRVPAGTYTVEAWHSHYGLLTKQGIEIRDGSDVTVDFAFAGDEAEPPENKGELTGLF